MVLTDPTQPLNRQSPHSKTSDSVCLSPLLHTLDSPSKNTVITPLFILFLALMYCEIIGDLAYLVSPLCLLSPIIWIRESSNGTLVLSYMFAYGFKTPTRGFSLIQ